MATTVSDLFHNAGLAFDGPVRWSHPVKNGSPGVYIVSTSSDPTRHLGLEPSPPISVDLVSGWIRRVPSIELDGTRGCTAADLAARLADFWLSDESILYIGMTTARVRTRVNQYYKTPLGDRRPHAGGHWLKTLSNLSELFLYHAVSESPRSKEGQLLGYFVSNVATETRTQLRDPEHPFPFANLEYPPGTRKAHGIGKSKL